MIPLNLPQLQSLVNHDDSTGEAVHELFHPCWGSGDDGGGTPLLWYSCEGRAREGMASFHQRLWRAPA